MFRGSSSINLDAKGRLTIPTRYREELRECCEQKMIVTLAVDERGIAEPGCLWLYPLPEWEKTEKIISGLPTMNKAAGNLRRFLIGNAQECEMDSQGRLLVSEQLRNYAEMEKKIVLVGQLSKFEIWAADAWDAKQNEWRQGGDIAGLEELGNLSF